MEGSQRLVRVARSAAGMNIWLAALGFVTAPIMLDRLGRPAYGVFAVVNLVSAQLNNLEFGFGFGMVRFLARAKASGDRAFGQRVNDTSLAVFLAGGAVGGLAMTLAAPWLVRTFADVPPALRDEAVMSFRIGGTIIFSAFLSSFFSNILQGLSAFTPLLVVQAATGTLASVAAVVTVLLGGDLVPVMVVMAVVAATGAIATGTAAFRAWGAPARPAIHWPTFREMGRFSVLIFGGALGYQLLMAGPAAVLAASVPAALVPAFSVPFLVLQKLVLLVTSASLGFFPYASEESVAESRERLARTFAAHLRVTTLVMGPIAAVLAVFADRLLTTWISADFAADAATPLRFLAGAALVLAWSSPPADASRALGRPGPAMAYTWVVGGLSVVGTMVLVGEHSASAPAVATLVALLVGTIPLLVYTAVRLLDFTPARLVADLAPVLAAVAALTGALLFGRELLGGIVGAGVVSAVALGVFVVACAQLVLRPEERRAVLAGVSR